MNIPRRKVLDRRLVAILRQLDLSHLLSAVIDEAVAPIRAQLTPHAAASLKCVAGRLLTQSAAADIGNPG